MDANVQTVSPPRAKRHFRTADERRRIVEETMAPGVSVATVARAHGINANLVFVWRKQYHAGLLGSSPAASSSEVGASCVRLLPVTVADVAMDPAVNTGREA
jgi:transposase